MVPDTAKRFRCSLPVKIMIFKIYNTVASVYTVIVEHERSIKEHEAAQVFLSLLAYSKILDCLIQQSVDRSNRFERFHKIGIK